MGHSNRKVSVSRFIPFIILAVIVCVLLGPELFGGKVLLPGGMLGKMSPWVDGSTKQSDVNWNVLAWDSCAQYYPARVFLGRALRSHELPLWNPYQFSGYPFLADVLSAVLYPPNLLYALFPADIVWNLLAALHLFAAGAFSYIFLRGLKLNTAASLFGAVGYMLGGFSIAWLELPVFISVSAWLPLILHFSRLAHERKSVYYASAAGIIMALSLVAGHPQIAFYTTFAVTLYWAYLGITDRREIPIWRTVILAIVALGVGVALAAPQIMAASELAALSHRGVQPPTAEGYAAYSRLAMPFQHLITLLIPDFFGNPAKGTYWGFNEYAEYCAYTGIATFLLIPFAFVRRRKNDRRHVWFFSALCLLALMMALGTSINRIFYFCIPGFIKSGSPARVLVLYVFGASVLGAFGLDRFLEDRDEKRPGALKLVVLSSLGLFICWVGLMLANVGWMPAHNGSLANLFGQSSQSICIFEALLVVGFMILMLMLMGRVSRQLGISLIVTVLCIDMFIFGFARNQTCSRAEVFPRTGLTDFLKSNTRFERIMPLNTQWSLRKIPDAVLPPNSAMMYGLHDVSGYDSLYPVKYKQLLDSACGGESCPPQNGNMVFARNAASPIYDLLGVRWFISKQPVDKSIKIGDCYLQENMDALPRTFIVHSIEYAADEDFLHRVAFKQTNLRTSVLVSADEAGTLMDKVLSSGDRSTRKVSKDKAVITSYKCNTITVKADTASDGFLILTDRYFPGWEAYVDGKHVSIMNVDSGFRGVPITPGKHVVLFSYEPQAFRKGLGITLFTSILLAIMGLIGLSVRSNNSSGAK